MKVFQVEHGNDAMKVFQLIPPSLIILVGTLTKTLLTVLRPSQTSKKSLLQPRCLLLVAINPGHARYPYPGVRTKKESCFEDFYY